MRETQTPGPARDARTMFDPTATTTVTHADGRVQYLRGDWSVEMSDMTDVSVKVTRPAR